MRRIALLCVAALVGGCSEAETAAVVTFELVGLAVPDEVDHLRLRLAFEDGDEPPQEHERRLEADGEHSFAIVRTRGDLTRLLVTAEATGPAPEGVPNARVSRGVVDLRVELVAGRTVHETLVFHADAPCVDRDGDRAYSGPDCADLDWDCADLDPDTHPGAPEACDGHDSDCDGVDAWLSDMDEAEADVCADEGWRRVGICSHFDVECVDGRWICPTIYLPYDDDCTNRLDMNCDGELDCECAEGEVARASACGDGPAACGTYVCGPDGRFSCEPTPTRQFCPAASAGCGQVAVCGWDDGRDRFAWTCVDAPEVEICNDRGQGDEDCDGLANAADARSCPLGAALGWSCAPEESHQCICLDGGRVLCGGVLTLHVVFWTENRTGGPPAEGLRVTAACDNCAGSCPIEPALARWEEGRGWVADIVLACEYSERVRPSLTGFSVHDDSLKLAMDVEVRAASCPGDCGSYEALELSVPLPCNASGSPLEAVDQSPWTAACTSEPLVP